LTIDRIVDAAIEVGLDSFSMKGVATHLGVTIATLYKYVDDRDHLFRLAVDKTVAITHVPEDQGQHWSGYILAFALATAERVASDTLIIDKLVHWGIGLETELRLADVLMEALTQRGFSEMQAQTIVRQVSIITFGAVVRMHSDRARAARHGSLARAVEETLRAFPDHEMEHVRAMQSPDLLPLNHLLREALQPLLATIAADRDETLP
jgi:AcrR family transcriptional regulator